MVSSLLDPGDAISGEEMGAEQLWQAEIRRPDDDKLVARGRVCLQNVDPR